MPKTSKKHSEIFIAFSQEYRTALISYVVTGKVQVPIQNSEF